MQNHFYRSPPCDAIRTALVLIAVDIETVPELASRSVLANVFFAVYFDRGAELEQGRTRDGISPPANVGSGGSDAGRFVRLLGDGVIPGNVGLDV